MSAGAPLLLSSMIISSNMIIYHPQLINCLKCVRLGKTCQYPAGRKPYSQRQSHPTQLVNHNPSLISANRNGNQAAQFPDAFFLDAELFKSVPHSAFQISTPVPSQVLQLIGEDTNAVHEYYFASVDTWFPFISRKRLDQEMQASLIHDTPGLALLLLCMKLVGIAPLFDSSGAESVVYRTARSYLNSLEELSPMSLHVFQSFVLMALYEIGHGIFPTAYLTVGRAARLGLLRGVHDRKHSTQVFQTPPTWTYWEEERRTWWAASILERLA